jgi:hypothetical protein
VSMLLKVQVRIFEYVLTSMGCLCAFVSMQIEHLLSSSRLPFSEASYTASFP